MDFEETFYEEERFIKVEEGEDWHATNKERAPGSKRTEGENDGNGRRSMRLSGRGDELVPSSGVEPGGSVESPGSFPCFCPVSSKSGNRHLITGRSTTERRRICRPGFVAAWTGSVLAILDDQSSQGQALNMSESEARTRYPHLVVLSLGAMRKEKPGEVISARVLFDGSNGIPVNRRIRIRDQERSPVASNLKRFMREKARRGEQTFSLTADVTEAHRQVPVDKGDCHLLGCQVEAGGDVYIDTVGTFDIASASYSWSRFAGSVGRITQCISVRSATTWHQLVADDFHIEAGGSRYRAALRSFSSCVQPLESRYHGRRLLVETL